MAYRHNIKPYQVFTFMHGYYVYDEHGYLFKLTPEGWKQEYNMSMAVLPIENTNQVCTLTMLKCDPEDLNGDDVFVMAPFTGLEENRVFISNDRVFRYEDGELLVYEDGWESADGFTFSLIRQNTPSINYDVIRIPTKDHPIYIAAGRVFVVNGIYYLYDKDGTLYTKVKAANNTHIWRMSTTVFLSVKPSSFCLTQEHISPSVLEMFNVVDHVWVKPYQLFYTKDDSPLFVYNEEGILFMTESHDAPWHPIEQYTFLDSDRIVLLGMIDLKDLINNESETGSKLVEISSLEDSRGEDPVDGSKPVISDIYKVCKDLQSTVEQLKAQAKALQRSSEILDNQLRLVETTVINTVREVEKLNHKEG